MMPGRQILVRGKDDSQWLLATFRVGSPQREQGIVAPEGLSSHKNGIALSSPFLDIFPRLRTGNPLPFARFESCPAIECDRRFRNHPGTATLDSAFEIAK